MITSAVRNTGCEQQKSIADFLVRDARKWREKMFLRELIFALLIAVTLSAIFFFGFRRFGSWPSMLVFFLIVFLAAWAGGLWLTPVGRPFWGVYWVPFLIAGIIFALLLAASAPTRLPRYRGEALRQAEKAKNVEAAVSMLMWVLIIMLGVAIITRYLYYT